MGLLWDDMLFLEFQVLLDGFRILNDRTLEKYVVASFRAGGASTKIKKAYLSRLLSSYIKMTLSETPVFLWPRLMQRIM